MSDTDQRQDAELQEHQHQLEQLEQVFPTPDTPQGGAQRVRIHVPSPDSLFTVGAPGHAASEGRAEGPGGFALHTAESLGAQIQGATIFDTDGNTILHSGTQTAVISEGDVVLSSNAHVRVGSAGDIEITAGEAGFTDPAFTVRPSMKVPKAIHVDTAGPRHPTHTWHGRWHAAWQAVRVAGDVRSFGAVSSLRAVTTAAVTRRAATILSLARATATLGEVAWEVANAAAEMYDSPPESESSAPQLKMHAAGGVGITSPEKVSVFSNTSVGIAARDSASVKAGWKASLKSLGNAKVYGVMSATLASEGVVGIKGTVVGTKAEFVELKAKQAAQLKSEGTVIVHAATAAELSAARVVVAGSQEVSVASEHGLEIDSKTATVEIKGHTEVSVASPGQVSVRGDRIVQLRQGSASVTLSDDEVTLGAGPTQATISSSAFSVHGLTVEQSEIGIRAPRIYLG